MDRDSLTRREFGRSMLTTLVSYTLLRAAFESRAFASPIDPEMRRWLAELQEICGDVKSGALPPVDWQDRIARLHARVPLEDLLRFIDFERMVRYLDYPDDRGAIVDVRFPEIEGLPPRRGFGSKIFAYKKGAATAPHGHNDLVSAHLVLRGSFHVRTYERLGSEPGHLLIAPSIDGPRSAGATVTMSDERDNVHWFVAASDHAYTFDVPVPGVYPDRSYETPANRYGMIYVDPAGPEIAPGRIRAPILSFEEALARYGSSHVG